MGNDRNRINIMTSCNDNLTKYIYIQLKTIALHMKNKEVHFYFFYNRVPEEAIDKLEMYCKYLGNITFHRIFIKEIEPYCEIAVNMKYDVNKYNWPYEAYFVLECHRYLPDDVERILYIDAGDVLFVDEIDEYYFDEFDGKSLIVRPIVAKEDATYFTMNDLADEKYSQFIKHGIFNSGSYIVNVDKFRISNTPMEKFVELSTMLEGVSRLGDRYNGDQGFLSIAFISRLKYFKYDEIKDVRYQQYNFTLALALEFRRNEAKIGTLWYDPKILHYVGTPVKPWKLIDLLLNEKIIKSGDKIIISEILHLAANFQQADLKHTKIAEPEENIIDIGMIPMYEYWFELNNIVQMDFDKLFKQN